ncbi:putative protein kinase CAMK-CAMKL-CHK1 family [Helianthus annuus]|nr:putative protein kinase CAMK-CAMKL-CHK1 family [Helianthus annuus]KAJ0675920.1 putative protein kinase CAMK-CAMKL-CHK1 family [Helianthus annuus]KAJ0679168.1 putative protein kinase CAMK-CAMKL-CHK1 family [Helianthus annuus]
MATTRTPSINRTASDGGTIILNKYQLTRLLGRGSFAKVYHGRSLIDDSSVAVKVIEKPSIADPTMEPRLVREVAAMRRLNHPNILKLHEVLATKTKIYLVMELAAGGELFTQLARRGRMKESTARRFFQQIVSTLHFCHENGVAHRDLKPQNLLLDENGNLKISDFGLSALPESHKDGLLHTACGTPAYTAPEIVRRKGYDGAKADAYSCGIILFMFLAGYLPFDDSNLANMYRKIHQRELTFPDWIPKQPRIIIQTEAVENDLESIKRKTSMNAFDLISMSSGLDLSGIFEEKIVKKERRFTTRATVAEIEKRVVEVGDRLGFRSKRMKDKENWNREVVGLVKGRVVVLAKVLEVAVELLLVEMTVVGGGDGLNDVDWEEMKLGFQDVVVSWHC